MEFLLVRINVRICKILIKSRDTDKRQTQVTLSTMKHPTVYPPSERIFLYLLLIGG